MNKVQIIILNKNNFHLLEKCVHSIIKNTTHDDYKILIADTGSDLENLQKIKQLKNIHDNRVSVIRYDSYHFEKIHNDIVKNHMDPDVDFILCCNNDICFMGDCLTEMLNTAKVFPDFGTIGARLYYADDSIQHHGILFRILEDGNLRIGHNKLRERDNFQEEGDSIVLGNTAALQLIRVKTFKELGGFPETYIDALSDVEFNLNCSIHGKTNILCGKALAYHYESQTRKSEGRLQMEDYNTLKQFVEKIKHKL